MARVQMRQDSVFMSTQEIWYTLWPTSFTKFRLFVEGDLHPTLWDPALLIIMAFPMWGCCSARLALSCSSATGRTGAA
jgi:hypothetical protein